MNDKLPHPTGPAPERPLPALPTAPGRVFRTRTSRTSHKPFLHARTPLSPVPEIPHPSEIQNMQLELEILNQELATERRQTEEMERQVASLEVDIQHYKRQIGQLNHLVAQIAYIIKFFSTSSRVNAERTQYTKPARSEMEQVPRQDNRWM